MFASKELLSKSFYYIAIKNNFEFKTVRSNSKSIEFKCSQDNCPWYVRASHYKGGELWRLRKYIANHNYSINVIQTTHKQVSSSLISDCIVKDFSSFDRSTPNDIMIHMRTKLGVNVSYYKAWRAKELLMNSLNGEAKESYALIPNFCMKLKEINPGSFTAYETDTEGHFKYCFMAIGACIEGWKYFQPNISVDDTFLKSKYGGTLLTASTINGKNQIFPLTFSTVDSENDASWRWFFENIKNSLGAREDLVVISYRHLSISKSVHNVFPNAEYCVCLQHILKSLKLIYKDPIIDKLFFRCGKAYTVVDFETNMRWMESMYPSIRDYLSKPPSRLHSQPQLPCQTMTIIGFCLHARSVFLHPVCALHSMSPKIVSGLVKVLWSGQNCVGVEFLDYTADLVGVRFSILLGWIHWTSI
ncbi:uncharacterized protein LOC127149765 [Cucumis melo]|uniref:Uncharacterized protein LOC127149765 n=1 Tax=Cucumis melo TaxID=3656 RepID=A0ABM3KV09_CUCME|nr:uncharacterized protein LOC127149765 [Cucumis melo]